MGVVSGRRSSYGVGLRHRLKSIGSVTGEQSCVACRRVKQNIDVHGTPQKSLDFHFHGQFDLIVSLQHN